MPFTHKKDIKTNNEKYREKKLISIVLQPLKFKLKSTKGDLTKKKII